MSRLVLLAMLSTSVSLLGCGGNNREANTGQAPPPQCPPGQYFDGQYCQMQSGVAPGQTPGAAPGAPGQTPGAPGQTPGAQPGGQGPIATAQPGAPAQQVDAASAQAATQLLTPLGQQHAPAGAKPLGSAIAGQFQQGQSLEQQVQMQPGKCYTIVAAAPPPVQNVDVQILATVPIPGVPSPVLAQDQTVGATAVIGEKPNCFKWAWPFAAAVKVILTVSQGQGVAAAQVYEK